MRRPRRPWNVAAALAIVALIGTSGGTAEGTAPSPRIQAAPHPDYDAVATDTARVLAGLDPGAGSQFGRVTARPAWRIHRAEFDRNWSRLEAERFAKMRAWRDRELKAVDGTCDTLFYPFGGPDFLNAFVLFPRCNRYLLFGLEPVGSVPAFDRLPGDEADILLTQVRASLSDIFVRDYFITKAMMNELRTPEVNGTLPLLLVFLARLDARVVDVRMESPWEGTAPAPGDGAGPHAAGPPARRPSAVTIRFTMPGTAGVRTLVYARVQMENGAFEKQTALMSYLDRLGPLTTLLKSASYLMHDNRFSGVRSVILARSRSVLEDDTGVPFRFFDKAGWDLTLFGRYVPPVKDFNYGRQPDLEAAYRTTSAARDLPFTFGYHWRQGTSSVILAVRRGTTP